MKIASWNVNSLRVRLPQIREWLAATDIDVLAVQETKVQDEDFPQAEIEDLGYRVAYAGQKTYNGVAVLSRGHELAEVVTEAPGLDTEQKRLLAATVSGVRVINLYVVQGREVGSDKYTFKLDWFKAATAFVKDELTRHERLIVLGDFNIAPADEDVHDPAQWAGKIMCSDAERDALGDMFKSGLTDVFRLFDQPDAEFSWWDYRGGGFRRNNGLRIDLILASKAMSLCCRAASVDKEPRSWERPSDHAPVIAEFDCE